MKLIIAGGRDLNVSIENIEQVINEFNLNPTIVISGKARGIDACGENWANYKNIPIDPYAISKEEWNKIGKAAGPLRNKQMAEYGDTLLLIWDGKSKGSKNMKEEMQKLNKPIYEVIIE